MKPVYLIFSVVHNNKENTQREKGPYKWSKHITCASRDKIFTMNMMKMPCVGFWKLKAYFKLIVDIKILMNCTLSEKAVWGGGKWNYFLL